MLVVAWLLRCPVLPPTRRASRAMEAASEALRAEGLLTSRVSGWLQAEEVETLDDLAHSFRSLDALRVQQPELEEAWLYATR